MESSGEVMRKILLILGFVAIVAGCTSVPVDPRIAESVPLDRIALMEYVTSAPDKRELIIKRDAYVPAATADARFYINGKRVANIGNGEVLRIFLRDGHYKLGVKTYGYDNSENLIQEIVARVEDGEDTVYRIFYGGMGFTIQPSSF